MVDGNVDVAKDPESQFIALCHQQGSGSPQVVRCYVVGASGFQG